MFIRNVDVLQDKDGKSRGGDDGCPSPPPSKCRDSRKAKQEPDLPPFPPLSGGKLKVEPGDEVSQAAGLGEEAGGMSPGREMLAPHTPHYGLGKEEVLGQLHTSHHLSSMGLDPALHHHLTTDPIAATCNNFSVDSIMTASRDGSPGERGQVLPDMSGYGRSAAWPPPSSPSHYPASCLYPGNTSLEELSSMTAACLSSQGQMSGLYPRPSWYAMPGHHSPNSLLAPGDQGPGAFPGPQRQDYFEAPGKPPSPGPECEGPYRSPQPYRTSYYGQECDKY